MDHEASTSHAVLERMLLDESAEPTSLPLSLLQYVTNRFSPDNQIGSGGFAVVYKGMVGNGTIAVKKLSNTFGLHENKFHEEVKCLIQAKHNNIIRFLGYCAEIKCKMEKHEGNLVMADQRNWLLCFEYACNGSLDKHITATSHGFHWRERYRIIRGICEGLLFLHEKRILHLDLKPANILLDDHMVPKICDFGISKCLGEEQTHATTKSQYGTLGYMDPEYLRSGQIDFASDIYSLGAIISEILTGARFYINEAETVVESWMNRFTSERDMQLEQVRVCIKIGKDCMDLDPKKRPCARRIIDMLDEAASADYPYESSTSTSFAELQVSLPREQSGEGKGEFAPESFQELDVDILEDSLWAAQDTKQKENRRGMSIFSSISSVLKKVNNLEIFNRKAHMGNDRNSLRHFLEQSDIIKIFGKDELKVILRSRNIIGEGIYSRVYKGVVDNAPVAVKIITDTAHAEKYQFAKEVLIQSHVSHKNIVRLIGCCLEMDTLILVYEFIPGGSLSDILHSDKKVLLSLDVRLKIVAESAQGLAYLHSQGRNKILHGDVKPANILLDDNFTPKIAGFGISRFIATDNVYTGNVIGDLFYMDPVYLQTGLLTEKSDVYSFGIMILEVISRKKATRKKAIDLFDKEIALTAEDLEILDCMVEIAMKCIKLDVDQRPTMTDIAERLLTIQQYHGSQVVRR